MILLSILGLVALIVLVATLFINLSPQFGGSISEENKQKYAKVSHYEDGKFVNPIPTSMDMKFGDIISLMGKYIKGNAKDKPSGQLPVEKVDSLDIVNRPVELTRLTWFGHSAFLLEIEGKNILIDPMLGDSPSPLPVLGTKRYSKELPIAIEKLPKVDAVIISHDHYDHLDYESIQKLKGKVSAFFVPLGVGAHLIEWGVSSDSIHEMNWWDETTYEGLTLVSAPARHFSGRGLFDRFNTLWCSWVIKGAKDNIYFSGDGGYGSHFKEIGDKYGPFDLAMMECGQYNKLWADIHMMPEETAQAGVDVNAKVVMPIHWGAFTLALHDWTDPVDRIEVKANELQLPLTTPKIGEPIVLQDTLQATTAWWKSVK